VNGRLVMQKIDEPCVDLALEVTGDLGDVVLENVGQGGLVSDAGDPAWELRVPAQVVTTDELAVLLGEVDKVVTTGEGEDTLLGLSGIPLHGVLWGQSTKVGLDDGGGLGVAQSTLVTDVTVVLLAVSLESSIDAGGGSTLSELDTVWLLDGQTSCSRDSGENNDGGSSEMHFDE